MFNKKRFEPPCAPDEQYKVCDSGTHRFFVAIVLILAFISCGYSYFHAQSHINSIREQHARELVEATRFKTDVAYQTIFDIGRYESKTAELMASRIINRINRDYMDDLPRLQKKFQSGVFSDDKFNLMVYDTISNSSTMTVATDLYSSGYLMFVKNKMLYNNMITDNTFAFDSDVFVRKSYNQFLANDFIDMIQDRRSETMIIEPRRVNWVDGHEIIHSLSYDNLYNIIKNEGFAGLNGYYVVRPAYITQRGDIFNVSDFDLDSGEPNDNFKICIVPYMSLYEYLGSFRKRSVDAIKVIEDESRKRAAMDERNAYYSSIVSLILHISAIFLILNLSGSLFFRNMISRHDVDKIQSKLTDRV